MAFNLDTLSLSHQLVVGEKYPNILGIGKNAIRGSAYIESPAVFGDPNKFKNIMGTVMIGPVINRDSPKPYANGQSCGRNFSPHSLCVVGDAVIYDNLTVTNYIGCGGDIVAAGDVKSQCGGHVLSSKKNFDIPHPTKEGWRLRHTCIEGPENAVFIRGKISKHGVDSVTIKLPEYWNNLVDFETITVSLTPFKKYQPLYYDLVGNSIIVHKHNNTDLFFHFDYYICGERIDGEKLISEYPGYTPDSYPGDNSQYSVSGYHYDRKYK
jgi:hypothetical protein